MTDRPNDIQASNLAESNDDRALPLWHAIWDMVKFSSPLVKEELSELLMARKAAHDSGAQAFTRLALADPSASVYDDYI